MKGLLYSTLKVLFKSPIVVLMLGEWDSGKTDASLLIAHLAKKWGLIDSIGSNIYSYNDPEVTYIISKGKLMKWLHADKSVKLFLFDEALKHIYRRKAMSKVNVDVVTEILPELSKAHGRMIFISQIEKLDSDAIHPAFCRAVFKKMSKKTMVAWSKHFRGVRTFRNLPRSPIRFDKDRLAPFVNTELSKDDTFRSETPIYRIADLYARGYSMTQIKDKEGLHQEQIKRTIRRALKWFCEHQRDFPEEKETENVNIEK